LATLAFWTLVANVVTQECSAPASPERVPALMQRSQSAHGAMQKAVAERRREREAAQKKKKQTPKNHHKGTVKLLQSQMTDFIAQKGQVGLTPDEIEHIHSIKAMIDDTILPTILQSVNESKAQLRELYDDILACQAKHTMEFNYSTEITEHPAVTTKTTMIECIKHEDELITEVTEACETMNRTRLEIMMPDGFDMPPPNVPDEEMIEYLKLMDEFFCGTYEVWHEEYTKCEELQNNFTKTKQDCKKLQKEYSEQHCSVSTELSASCGDLDTCHIEAVKRYNEKKRSALELEFERIEEYEGAIMIECLWSAWIYEYMPCTVNKTRVRECHEVPPNLTEIIIEFPEPPPPPECGDDAFHAALGTGDEEGSPSGIDPCSEEWSKRNFAELGLHQELIDELKAACEPCAAPKTWTAAPQEISHMKMTNVEHTAGSIFIKTSMGQGECDAVIETEEANVQSITITPQDLNDKIIVELFSEHSDFIMEMQKSIATIGDGGLSDDVAMYHDGDILALEVMAGKAIFLKNGKPFHEEEVHEDMVSGRAKVRLCSAVGESVHVDFAILDI